MLPNPEAQSHLQAAVIALGIARLHKFMAEPIIALVEVCVSTPWARRVLIKLLTKCIVDLVVFCKGSKRCLNLVCQSLL